VQFLSFTLWKTIGNDAGLVALIGACGVALGILAFLLVRLATTRRVALACAAVAAIAPVAPLRWYLPGLADTRRASAEVREFAFVRELKGGPVTCASAKEGTLVIPVTICGITEPSAQDRLLAELRRRSAYDGTKPVVVSFHPATERTETTNAEGSKVVIYYTAPAVRQALLPQEGIPTAAPK
jgi:hypothetical protein